MQEVIEVMSQSMALVWMILVNTGKGREATERVRAARPTESAWPTRSVCAEIECRTR
jgi:hypothetical protein